jgi:hypothetical protein
MPLTIFGFSEGKSSFLKVDSFVENMDKKRVVMFYSVKWGRNDGAPLYYFEALKRMGDFDVVHLEPEGDITEFGNFDYTFWVDWGEDGLPRDNSWQIPKNCGETIYVVSDAHLGQAAQEYRFGKALTMDYIFFNQKRALEESGMKDAIWLPHAVEPLAYPHFEIIKKYDVCFIGHLQDKKNYNGFSRIDMLDRAFKEFPNFYFGTRNMSRPGVNMFEDAARKFCMSRVVLNISIADDINMRVFEVMATGSFLLTNWIPTLGDLFEDGKHLATYKTLDEMVEKIKYYLEHEEEREKIAQEGQKEVLAKHTYSHRIETILSVINFKQV